MKRTLFFLSLCFLLFTGMVSAETSFKEIRTDPEALAFGDAHVQGICCGENAIYLTFNNAIFKIDWEGNLIKSAEAKSHSGDPCIVGDRLFVAMSEPGGHAVFEYDTDLNLIAERELDEAPASDGIAFMNGHFFLGGPSAGRTPHLDNLVLEYDRDFRLVKRHTINFGVETSFGTQSIEAYGDTLFMAFYVPNPDSDRTIQTDGNMNVLRRFPIFAGNGIALLPPSKQGANARFLIANTEYTADKKPIAVFRFYELSPEPDAQLVDITE